MEATGCNQCDEMKDSTELGDLGDRVPKNARGRRSDERQTTGQTSAQTSMTVQSQRDQSEVRQKYTSGRANLTEENVETNENLSFRLD